MNNRKVKVLFVCLGNICRSPMAEAVFRDLIQKEGLENKFEVDSAGIGDWHIGQAPHQGTQEVLKGKSIMFEGMKARQVKESDWDEFAYIVAMDAQNRKDLMAIRKPHENIEIKLLMDYVPNSKEKNVPDPYFTGNFDYTYELIKEGCTHLLQAIKKKWKL
ncbi:protein-tyrosine phosphatase [Salirhabdus euzebyi]|uniref:protein-tyrosine-phosphatase n=1 Tax=Salirhabdus euzebyi TaxID=394506 RepID=A0A841Q9K9_9BACI|nr:low molecular weight protein-tyrosine-phosphatase [Salirhabdus euzebyi]MBB6455379.1 protein-tyrosine phosphatase [Salirhabdus euzebyi]